MNLSKNLIRKVQALHRKKGRDEANLFIAEGEKIVAEMITSDQPILDLFATQDWLSANHHLVNFAQKKNVMIHDVSLAELKSLSTLTTPNNVLVSAPKRISAPFSMSATKGLTLVLDEIQDPGNLGTIIRTADWFGIDQIVCSRETADVYNTKVLQATMGSFLRIDIFYMDLEPLFEENLKTRKMPVLGTLLEGNDIRKSDVPLDAFLLFGNESSGISKSLRPYITHKLFIPSSGNSGAESLNVSVALGIVLYKLTSSTL